MHVTYFPDYFGFNMHGISPKGLSAAIKYLIVTSFSNLH